MNDWVVPEIWKDGECWILAGGSSVIEQFNIPDEISGPVTSREKLPDVYSPYFKAIHNKHIIGVNNAFLIGGWIDVLFFGDCNWHITFRYKLAEFPGLKVTCCPKFAGRKKAQMEGIKYLAKDKDHRHGLSLNKKKVSWNGNSGASAIGLAVHFGVKRIILLGFDMNFNGGNNSHWHGSHRDPKEAKPKPGIQQRAFNKHLKGFPDIARDAEALGVEIINASPNSEIDVFPKASVEELL